MHVSDLFLYPVKGLKGIRVEKAELTQRGFKYDRRFMLVDRDGLFLSQRSHPDLATYHTGIGDDGMVTIKKEMEHVSFSMKDSSDEVIEVTLFDQKFCAHGMNEHIDLWWRKMLKEDVRLVALKESDIRIKEYKGHGDRTEVSFADGYPYLILGSESLNMLNNKLTDTLSMDRFRPNIVIKTNEPHIEDTLSHFKIGSQNMYIVKPCARCQVVTIDQELGIRTKEPLQTLATYRKSGNKVNFGANAISLGYGFVSLGDQLTF